MVVAEQWNTERVREELGAKTIRSASVLIRRLGLKAVAREPGRTGMDLYDADDVRAAIEAKTGGSRETTKELG